MPGKVLPVPMAAAGGLQPGAAPAAPPESLRGAVGRTVWTSPGTLILSC